MQELIKNRSDAPSEKPKTEKTVGELEEARRVLEVECRIFAGENGKGGVIAELSELLVADEKEEAELIEMLGANADLEQELAPARQAREEDRKQIEHLKNAYDQLLVEIAQLNKQIRELREAQAKEGTVEVAKEVAEAEDLTEHAALQPPPIPFAVRDASIAKHRADLDVAEDLTEHAALQPPPIPEAVRQASIAKHQADLANVEDLSEHVVAMDPWEDDETSSPVSSGKNEQGLGGQAKKVAPVEAAPVKPEPAAKNEAGPETVEQAQAFLAEDQRERMEIQKQALKLYQTYKNEVLPQIRGIVVAAEKLAALQGGSQNKQNVFASLPTWTEILWSNARASRVSFASLQSYNEQDTPEAIEARTHDVHLLQTTMNIQVKGIYLLRNELLAVRSQVPKGSLQEKACIAIDQATNKTRESIGKMQADWQPVYAKINGRNTKEYRKLYEAAYGVLVNEGAKGKNLQMQVPEDVQQGMPKERIPQQDDLIKVSPRLIDIDMGGITGELQQRSGPDRVATSQGEAVAKQENEEAKISVEEYRGAEKTLQRMKEDEETRHYTTEDIIRRTRRFLSDLDFAKGPEAEHLRTDLEEVIRQGNALSNACEENDEMVRGYYLIIDDQKSFVSALEDAKATVSRFEDQLPQEMVSAVRRLTTFVDDLPPLSDPDELLHAREIKVKFEAQKQTPEKLPRIGI